MTLYEGGPAFPQHGWSSDPAVLKRMENQGGMTLRAWLAGRAMQGLLSDQRDGSAISRHDPKGIANECVRYADALLQRLEEP